MNPTREVDPPTLLCLVRHGATSWNDAHRLQGRTDVPLSVNGTDQARRLAQALPELAKVLHKGKWDAVYVSPLRRALETAAEVAAVTGLTPVVRKTLVERAFGELEGLTRRQLERDHPGWTGKTDAAAGVESQASVGRRAVSALEAIADNHPGGAVLVVSHGAFLGAFLHRISDDIGSDKTPLSNGGYSLIQRAAGRWTALAVNVTDHLEGDGPATHTPSCGG